MITSGALIKPFENDKIQGQTVPKGSGIAIRRPGNKTGIRADHVNQRLALHIFNQTD